MKKTSFGTDDVMIKTLEKHADRVRRICFLYLRNYADVEDAFQEVFLKLLLRGEPFESEEHEKAWICRVAVNKCKDMCKNPFRKKVCSLADVELAFEDTYESEVMAAVLALPPKYRDVIYLYYYEGYTAAEIAALLHRKENTVSSHLHRARALLKQKLGGSEYGYDF